MLGKAFYETTIITGGRAVKKLLFSPPELTTASI
jgi:hypothetical protein